MDWGRSSRMKTTNSDEALSSMTGDFDARGQIRHAQFQEDESSVWTDEKHSAYIQSLEATFVQQLRQSGGFTCRTSHHQQFANNTHDSSDKFTGLQQFQVNMGSTKHDTLNAAFAEVSDQNFADEQQQD